MLEVRKKGPNEKERMKKAAMLYIDSDERY
jgi:hypothetical protein